MEDNATDNGMRLEISRLYNSGTLSDLTITCGSHKFPVHKIILYVQSEYFRKLFGGPFKEASTDTLDLPDDDPHAIRVLIRYFYNNLLDTSFPRPDSHVHRHSDSAFLVQLYAVADKYDVPRLRSLLLERLDATCDPVKSPADLIGALIVVDEYTCDNTVWDILMPKVKANPETLLKDDAFKEVVMGQSAMTLQLLGSFASGAQTLPAEATRRRTAADFETPVSKRARIPAAGVQKRIDHQVRPVSSVTTQPSPAASSQTSALPPRVHTSWRKATPRPQGPDPRGAR